MKLRWALLIAAPFAGLLALVEPVDPNEAIIDRLIEREGGYVDHPADRGGATKYGITQRTLSAHRDCPANVKNLDRETAREIYHEHFILAPGYDQIPDPQLREIVVDAAVHHGPAKATELLQHALGVEADGIFGPVTQGALTRQNPQAVAARFLAERIRFMGRIVDRDHDQSVFIEGWLNRATSFLDDMEIPDA